jgi:hypothetical protein
MEEYLEYSWPFVSAPLHPNQLLKLNRFCKPANEHPFRTRHLVYRVVTAHPVSCWSSKQQFPCSLPSLSTVGTNVSARLRWICDLVYYVQPLGKFLTPVLSSVGASLVFLCTPETGRESRTTRQPATCTNSYVSRCFAIRCPLWAHTVCCCCIVIITCKCILSLPVHTVYYTCNWTRFF